MATNFTMERQPDVTCLRMSDDEINKLLLRFEYVITGIVILKEPWFLQIHSKIFMGKKQCDVWNLLLTNWGLDMC